MKKRNNILSTVFTPCLQFVCTTSLLVIIISFLAGKAYGVTLADIGKIIFWTVECIFVLALCMEILGWGKALSTKRLLLTSGLYAASFCVVWLSSNYLTLNFWMLGILIIGLIIPSEMAIALHIILTYWTFINHDKWSFSRNIYLLFHIWNTNLITRRIPGQVKKYSGYYDNRSNHQYCIFNSAT